MSSQRESRRVLTATQIAAFCDVDLKTIHNWADRGKIRGWRTEGRHLRFRRLDVVDFLRAYGFSIPVALRAARPHVVAVDADKAALQAIERALARRFEVTAFEHVVDALVALAETNPEVAVVGDVSPLDAAAVAARLALLESTRHVRVVALGGPAGALPHAPRGDAAKLRAVLERLTGVA